jgi:hypothetical protein
MELLNLIFRLGVLFAIYSFLWFFFDLGLSLLRGGRQKTIFENYLITSVKYLFLVNVTFLFCLDLNETVNLMKSLPSIIILTVYFIGKFQSRQRMANVFGQMEDRLGNQTFDSRTELALIAVAIVVFVALFFFPQYANNNIALWFKNSIEDLQSTVLIGFIFKVIGFFFLISMIMKMLNAINYVISGRPLVDIQTNFRSKKGKKDDEFDDYEEIK